MDEYGCTKRGEYDVGTTRQIAAVESKAEPCNMERAADTKFRRRVTSPDARHHS
jgi:hypothetical protein